MSVTLVLIILAVILLAVLAQLGSALGWKKGLTFAALLLGPLVIAGWYASGFSSKNSNAATDRSAIAYVTSESCFKCHESHYASWHRTFHRTMTREATAEYVKGDFNNASYRVYGVGSRMTREGDAYYMETADRTWADRMFESGLPPEKWGQPVLRKYSVDRLVGSHWFQEFMHKEANGRYVRLPLSYHIVEKRWIHTNGAFLAPDTNDFWNKSTAWNESCVFCHNTKPAKRPQRDPSRPQALAGYQTHVEELGIACEACHGPGEEHVHINQSLARRWAVVDAGAGDPTIVNPKRLSSQRASEICGHCHGSPVPKPHAWDLTSVRDPFNAGDDLTNAFAIAWSEAQMKKLHKASRDEPVERLPPEPTDGRFWGDGTPLTTALEYQGMALSACYENGQGRLSCLSCHSLHDSDPNHQVARGMETNEACYNCHNEYRDKLVEHTHHPAGSPGSLCYNCHMPYQVYSLLSTHRSHRIQTPRVKDSLGTGKPHACNLCHLDESLGWTQDHLNRWYGHERENLSEEESKYASSLVLLAQGDARTRVVVAGAFSWPPTRQASGDDWFAPVLLRLLEPERYPAVRYLAHRGLRAVHDREVEDYYYLSSPADRRAQLQLLQSRLRLSPNPARYPHLPWTPEGQLDRSVIDVLLKKRNDPDVVINE